MNLMLLAASFWTGTIGAIILMVIGFGLVIFIHELGHFLVAKWVGIKVEQFAIGFGKRLVGFQWGETEYRVNVLPLGGYVKMLGQDDLKPTDPEMTDPRAYNNRPVWARICVVSAGVVMNVILAAILFMIVFAAGIRFMPPVIGSVRPGYPADLAGLQPGDRVKAIDGKAVRKFDQLKIAATLSRADEKFCMLIERPGVPEPFEVWVGTESIPSPSGAVTYAFGLGSPLGRVLGAPFALGVIGEGFKTGDQVVSVAGRPIEHGWQLYGAQQELTAAPIDVVVDRDGQAHTVRIRPHVDWSHDAEKKFWLAAKAEATSKEAVADIESPPFEVLGLQPRMRVWLVDPEGPAGAAGIKTGDVIAHYGETREVPTLEQFKAINKDYIDKEAPIEILRDGKRLEASIRIGQLNGEALAGLTPKYDDDHLVVASVLPDSPLAGTIESGSTITAVNGKPVSTWPELIERLADCQRQGQSVKLAYQSPGGAAHVSEELNLATAGFDRADYTYALGLLLTPERGEEVQAGPIDALGLGVRETGDFIVLTYATLRGFFTGRVSGKEFSGPVGIFRVGVKIGERGVVWVIWLMAIISANLAVINFLPLPIVDGGHVVMLLIEKIRRKPLSLRVQTAIQVAGLVALGVVFVLITYNDIAQWVSSQWW